MSRLSKHACFLFFCVLLVFSFCRAADAQSGRKINQNPASTEQKPAAETKTTKTETKLRKNETMPKISSMTIVGEVQQGFAYYSSNEIDGALKEFIFWLKLSSKSAPEVTRGSGKTSYKAAKEQAAKEIDKFTLWLGFSEKADAYGNAYIESVQYALLSPEKAEIVTRGEIIPKQNGTLSTGGVLNIPNGRKRTTAFMQMKDAAREIAGILLRGGWLE